MAGTQLEGRGQTSAPLWIKREETGMLNINAKN
jgi:hypothetical protein